MSGADAAFAHPEVFEFLEAEGYRYAIRLPCNDVLEGAIEPLLTRPGGRSPESHEMRGDNGGSLCPAGETRFPELQDAGFGAVLPARQGIGMPKICLPGSER